MVQTTTNWQRDAVETVPEMINKEDFISQVNSGEARIDEVKEYYAMGYAFIIHAGTLADIERDMPATKRRDLKCAN